MYGIGSYLIKAARFYPDRIACADINGALTYAELNNQVNRIANYLLEHSFTKGSRIAFVCDNCNEFVQMWLATQKIGVVSVLLSYRSTRAELSRDVRRARCEAMFYSSRWTDIITRNDLDGSDVRLLISFGPQRSEEYVNLEDICAVSSADEPVVHLNENEWATILFTSGSTGLSKGVVRTHRILNNYAMQIAAEHEYYKTKHICLLSHSPLFHTGGLSMLLKTLALCGTYVGVNGLNPVIYGELIEKYQVNQLFLVPPVNIMRFGESESFRTYDTSSVEHIWATGGKLSKEYVLTMLELFPGAYIKTSYGGTEFCAACSITHKLTPEQVADSGTLLESAGYIGLFADVRLVDENGNDVPQGESGELWVSSPFVMDCYMNDPESTAEVLTDGWYHTGDIFRMDADGLLYFLDRKSAMIKTGGENVFPAEVESVLRDHPSVLDCAIVAKPDPKWGEAVAAVLVPAEGHQIDLEDVARYARDRLAGFRKPRFYLVLDELPKTASGKTDRKALKDFEKYHFMNTKEILDDDK